MKTIGQQTWVMANGPIADGSRCAQPEMIGHETACLLNASDQEAHVEITVFFVDREPLGPYCVMIPARRIRQLHFDDFTVPAAIPCGTAYAGLIESDAPIVVQRAGFASRRMENVPATRRAYAAGAT